MRQNLRYPDCDKTWLRFQTQIRALPSCRSLVKRSVLGVQRSRTSKYHPASNGTLERWHGALHEGMSHYVNSSHSTGIWSYHSFQWPTGQRPTPLPGTALSS